MAGGLVPGHMLLALLLDQGEGRLPLQVGADPHDPSRQVVLVLGAGGYGSQVGAAGVELQSQGLGLAADEVGPLGARSGKASREQGVHADQGEGPVLPGDLAGRGDVLDHPEAVGGLDHEGGELPAPEQGLGLVQIDLPATGIGGQGDQLHRPVPEPTAPQVGAEHLEVLGPQAGGGQDLPPLLDAAGHPGAFGQGGRSVVDRAVDRRLPQDPAHQQLEVVEAPAAPPGSSPGW